MKINTDTVTLVDQVEHSLLNYFKDNDLRCGDPIPNEHQLADEFGVGRSVVREAYKVFAQPYQRVRSYQH